MKHKKRAIAMLVIGALSTASAYSVQAAQVTYQPYIQPGDAGRFDKHDQKVIAWQTDDKEPNNGAYVVEFGRTSNFGRSAKVASHIVDNYLSADPSLPVPANASGAHVNYYSVLKGLKYNTKYYYRVTGPGLPSDGFVSSFTTRKRNSQFSFQVVGDEGFFQAVPNSNPPQRVNYESRIVHEMYDVHKLSIPGVPQLPDPDLALNTGDNVYFNGSEGNYRDFWMPVWNNAVSSNETGAPFIRHIPYYIVIGNHDIGSTGISANLLGDDNAGKYSGGTGGGDALQYFNNFYFPLNGPKGVDPQYTLNGDDDSATPNGFYFKYQGVSYDSPTAIEAFRASTEVNTGKGMKRQIDTMGNYSFDNGNAHFVFLDANPHVFNGLLSYAATYTSPAAGFPKYPNTLAKWLINDLDSSDQTWKFVVFHHPAFSSGNLTMRNFQMRRIAKFLEDHGVNVVFNGHEHNYQRTYPLRAMGDLGAAPTTSGPAVVAIDNTFDGKTDTVPDGVIYLVEGAGGEDTHDSGLALTRGAGPGADQDDSATGTFTYSNGMTFPNGPASWLDDHLTGAQMDPFLNGAGQGPKITARFKSHVFSFADVVINHNQLTMYQISEPLQATSSATAENPAPFGTDVNGIPLNDPIPDTLIDSATGKVVSAPEEGTPALLDQFTITKPELGHQLKVQLQAPRRAVPGATVSYTLSMRNDSSYALNGTQAVFTLPAGSQFAGAQDDSATQHGDEVVVTVGRLAPGAQRKVSVTVTLPKDDEAHKAMAVSAKVRSATAMPVIVNPVVTKLFGEREHG
ncbi:MAG: DUF11 domain-containing protein [Gammaproteobacteria bacterium]|nr:DUF11 domain-containing protein [Gammaproteobacteria bacterium]